MSLVWYSVSDNIEGDILREDIDKRMIKDKEGLTAPAKGS